MSLTTNTLKGKRFRLLVGLGFAALLCGASPAMAQISLGTAENFGVLGGSTVTNTGPSLITGHLGVSPGTAVTGFPPGIVVAPSTIHSADAVAAQAQIDLTTAYNAIAGTPTLVDLTGQNLGGLTLTPGVYGFDSSAQLTGTLTLDSQGNPNAVFIFKIGSTLTTASNSSVVFINTGGNSSISCNVFWQVGSSATLGTATGFAGNILALTSITLNTGANVSGRVLARNGAVTLDTNNVTVCPPAPIICPIITLSPTTLPDGVTGTPYSATVTATGGAAPYTYAVSSGALPPVLLLDSGTGAITGTPTTAGTFIFTITATDANGCSGSQLYSIVIAATPPCPPITLSPLALPAGVVGTPYNQTVTATGGVAPYTFASAPVPPVPGLTLSSAGVLSGSPTTVGIFNFTITVMDSNQCPGSQVYSISITGCPVITVRPPTLPAGVVGTGYNQTVTATGGAAPYTFAVSSGALPTGLSLNTGTGVIAGPLNAAGTFSFIITATDTNGCTGLLGYTMTIAAAPAGTVIPTLSEWGMIIFMMLVVFVSVYYLRRQKARA
ncbi:MAG: IPTL-CTERM sorting domain-containing protein [Acidobacteria bacterium]|nr:MAG: IPTL-CTERM sorting domain-containing protein [Acidobacteriota bacterium]